VEAQRPVLKIGSEIKITGTKETVTVTGFTKEAVNLSNGSTVSFKEVEFALDASK